MTIQDNIKDLIERIKENQKKDLFNTPIIVFDNLNIEQWFKTNWLKSNNGIYMNIKCIRFNDLYKMIFNNVNILDSNTLKKIIINHLISLPKKPDYILDGNEINQMRLYDYAKKMASLFTEYDNDLFDITGQEQKDLYDTVNNIANGLGYYNKKALVNNQYKEISNPLYVFVTRELTKLEEEIINSYNNQYKNKQIGVYKIKYTINFDKEIKYVASCPSRLKEIEVLHSAICQLINGEDFKVNKTEVNKLEGNTKQNDIVVYAPDLSKYQNDIVRVFKQNNKEYPNVPFVLSMNKDNDIIDFLGTILRIMRNGYCTRKDFVNIASNDAIRRAYKFTNEDVDTIIDTIVKTNTYRDRQGHDDWQKLKERILLSKLVGDSPSIENIAIVSNQEENVPYSSISLNDELKVKLISIINFIIELKQIKLTDSLDQSFDKFENMIEELFGEENSSYSYITLYKELESFNAIGLKDSHDIKMETLMYSLLEIGNYNILEGIPFATGITFLDMKEKNVVKSEHTFIIGMDSKSFPRVDITDPLNLNSKKKTNNDIDKDVLSNILNNSENVYVSYVDKDLKTDEEFFLSPLIKSDLDEVEISIDEQRDYSELFTKREIKNKSYYKDLIGANKKDPKETKQVDSASSITPPKPQEPPKSLTTKQLSDYLDEPLKAKAAYLIGIYDDEKIEDVNSEFEPLEIDYIDRSSIVTDLLVYLSNIDVDDDISNINIDNKKLYSLKQILPTFNFDKKEIDTFIEFCIQYIKHLRENNFRRNTDNKLEVITINDLDLEFKESDLLKDDIYLINQEITSKEEEKKAKEENQEDTEELDEIIAKLKGYVEELNKEINENEDPIDWTVSSYKSVFIKEEDNNIIYAQLRLKFNDKITKFSIDDWLELYVLSLVDIARRGKGEFNVKLLGSYCKSEFSPYYSEIFTMTPKEAKLILCSIYLRFTDFTECISINRKKEMIESKYDLYNAMFGSYGKWEYYKDKNLFGIDDLATINGKSIDDKDELSNNYSLNYFILSSLIKCK